MPRKNPIQAVVNKKKRRRQKIPKRWRSLTGNVWISPIIVSDEPRFRYVIGKPAYANGWGIIGVDLFGEYSPIEIDPGTYKSALAAYKSIDKAQRDLGKEYGYEGYAWMSSFDAAYALREYMGPTPNPWKNGDWSEVEETVRSEVIYNPDLTEDEEEAYRMGDFYLQSAQSAREAYEEAMDVRAGGIGPKRASLFLLNVFQYADLAGKWYRLAGVSRDEYGHGYEVAQMDRDWAADMLLGKNV